MKKVTVQLVDDLDGAVIGEGSGRTVRFAFDGQSFEIDLSQDNEQHLRDLLGPYLNAARAVKAGRRAANPPKSGSSELQAIREWARGHGMEVSDRGRISATVREAYAASL